jgi:hypothetical protein
VISGYLFAIVLSEPEVKEKDRQTIQWQKDNQKSQRIDRQYNGQKIPKGQSESLNRPLYCVFFVDLLIVIARLVSFDHCIVCSSSIY